jgi:hypothetical protein
MCSFKTATLFKTVTGKNGSTRIEVYMLIGHVVLTFREIIRETIV